MTSGTGAPLRLPLRRNFQFVHEALTLYHKGRFVGREVEADALAHRLALSHGGAFLITGYRGVGKTSFVNEVIRRIPQRLNAGVDVLDIHFNLARPLNETALMHHILRSLYVVLTQRRILQYLEPRLRQLLETAVKRTSFAIASKRSAGLEGTLSAPKTPLFGLGAVLGAKLSVEDQLSYLGYDDKAAEFDLLQISEHLTRGFVRQKRLLGVPFRSEQRQLKLVFIFDELDKLDEFSPSKSKAVAYIDRILGSLKNLFTASGICFVFVAGKELDDRWREDLGRGDSIFESVFAYHQYLPCLWERTADMCGSLLEGNSPEDPELLEDFQRYLTFHGRGVPRRIFRVLHEHVQMDDQGAAIVLTRQEQQRIASFADLQSAIELAQQTLFPDPDDSRLMGHRDKLRLAVYHLIDWIVYRGREEFTKADVIGAAGQLSAKLALPPHATPGVVYAILNFLIKQEYLRRISEAEETQLAAQPSEPRYALNREKLVGVRSHRHSPDAPPDVPLEGATPAAVSASIPPGYTILATIGSGGSATTYSASDQSTGRRVALKVLHPHLAVQRRSREQFSQEAARLREFSGKGVPNVWADKVTNDSAWIAMDFIEGASLRTALIHRRKLPLELIEAIASPIAEIVQGIHDAGWVRLDLKPGNIRLGKDGTVWLIDLGTLLRLDPDGLAVQDGFAGTPVYSAPEQLRGEPVGHSSDVFSFGVLLYELLTGERPFDGIDGAAVLAAQKHFVISDGPLSSQLRGALHLSSAHRTQRIDGVLRSNLPDDQRKSLVAKLVGNLVNRVEALETGTKDAISEDSVRSAEPLTLSRYASSRRPSGPHLIWAETSQYMALIGDKIRIGRQGEIAIPNMSLSRSHAVIERDADGYYTIRDDNSVNGTFLNDQRVPRKLAQPLQNGDRVRLGQVTLEFAAGTSSGAPEESPPPPPPPPSPPLSSRSAAAAPQHQPPTPP